jgi:hypothetical protein
MITLSCYHDNVIMLSCYYDTCYHIFFPENFTHWQFFHGYLEHNNVLLWSLKIKSQNNKNCEQLTGHSGITKFIAINLTFIQKSVQFTFLFQIWIMMKNRTPGIQDKSSPHTIKIFSFIYCKKYKRN